MALTGLTQLQPNNIQVVGIATFDQSVGIAGTLTYQDVTNVDAVGIVTARSGIDVSAGDLTITDKIVHAGDTNTTLRFPSADMITAETAGTERFRIDSNGHVRFGSSGSASSADWGHSTYGNTEVAIDGGGGYGVLHFRGDGGGSVNTRFSMGAGDDKFYMAYQLLVNFF